MKRGAHFLLLIIVLGLGTIANAQNSLSFYHLGDATYQNSNFNPAWMPDASYVELGYCVVLFHISCGVPLVNYVIVRDVGQSFEELFARYTRDVVYFTHRHVFLY